MTGAVSNKTSTKRRYRCAIYTRKSHEERLDQAFNSLDAQREACEAYVCSQAGLGWELIDKAYDDGGISGGHMEREGLQHLLADIRAGQVDVVVVYKVDRLTRSIADFGKLVELFDAQDVSFVSVTQAFNTTNSMGRLTLNVLLSFAQFEREVTAERIRDKIASSKQKGMWMGGRVPFGYRNEARQLFIEPEEAEAVRLMFDLYLKHQTIMLVKNAVDRQGILSRTRTGKFGNRTGGLPFSKGNIATILSNPIYAGMIRHKETIHPGNHKAIIEQEKWDRVQAILADRSTRRSTKKKVSSPACFTGLLFDQHGNRLILHHANKKGKKYHYYVSQQSGDGTSKADLRIPVGKLDHFIQSLITEMLQSRSVLMDWLSLQERVAEEIAAVADAATKLAENLTASNPEKRKAIYNQIIQAITVYPDRLKFELDVEGMEHCLQTDLPNETEIMIEKPMTIRRRGQEMKLIIGGIKQQENNFDQALIGLIAKAHRLKTELESGEANSIKAFAETHGIDHGDAKNLIPLSYLAPSIVEDIMAGHQPADLTAIRLKQLARHLPKLWSEQRHLLGFAT